MRTAALLFHACSGTVTGEDSSVDVQRGHSQSCRTAATSQHRGLRCMWLVWITSRCISRGLLLFSAVCHHSPSRVLWLACTSFTAWRSVRCLAFLATSRVPEHLERHAVLARLIKGRQSHCRIHGRRELDYLKCAGSTCHGSMGGPSGPGVFCHQYLTGWRLRRQVVVCVTATGSVARTFIVGVP